MILSPQSCTVASLLLASCIVKCSLSLSCAPAVGRPPVEIPAEWVNDGYCDCPLDGNDEPDTAACSGSASGGWAGLSPRVNVADKDASEDEELPESAPLFACPQQPKMKLHTSRTNDGICDCCDGADEANNSAVSCSDDCAAVLAAEREARGKVIKAYKEGSQKRQAGIADYAQLVKETEVKLSTMKNQIEALSTGAIVQQLDSAKLKYWQTARRLPAQNIVDHPDMAALLQPLTDEELVTMIVHACQLAGEMDTPTTRDYGSTCAALRLAGMDYGITWSEENFDDISAIQVSSEGSEGSSDLAQEVFQNRIRNNDESMKWKAADASAEAPRRRLDELDDVDDMEDYDHDEDHDDYDDGGYEDMYDDEDYMGDDDYESNYEPPARKSRHDKKNKNDEPEGKRKEMIEMIQAMPFSKSRMSFSARSKAIAVKVAEILDADDEKDDENNVKEDEEKIDDQPEKDDSAPRVDPAALNMVRSKLQGRGDRINRGFKYGASAKVLMDSLRRTSPNQEQFRTEALVLAAGTIYHGKLSSKQVWQVVQGTVSELSSKLGPSSDEQSCASAWANSCPPSGITRNAATFPPLFLKSAGESFCDDQTDEALLGLCVTDSPDTIPADVPEGFFGYHSPSPRDSKDPLEAIFEDMNSNSSSDEQLSAIRSLEDTKNDLDQQSTDIKNEMKKLFKEIGGKSDERAKKFGSDGELFPLKDQCHSVTAGKYIYEVCVFGSASQKDRDNASSSGTSLGRWAGIENNGEGRIMKWTNGQKCWNGPNRSATVHVTCGAEHKVLSADEPDTCRYVLEMESPIACDDDYKQLHNL